MNKLSSALKKINSSADLKELSVNSLWSMLGAVISKGLIFLAWLMVAKILGKEGNGEVGIVRSTINVFAIFVGSGIALTTTKYIPELLYENSKKVNKIFTLSISFSSALGFLLSLFLFFGAGYISTHILNASQLELTLKISAYVLFLTVISSVITGCLKGFKDFKGLLICNVIYGISLFLALYFLTNAYGVEGTFTGFCIGTLMLVLSGGILVAKNMYKNNLKFDFKFNEEFKILRNFTLPAILTGAMVMPFKWGIDTLMVNHKNGYEELGLYSALILFQSLIMMVTATLDAPLITIMVKKQIDKRIERLNLITPWAIGIYIVLPVLFFPSIFNVFLSEEYVNDPNFYSTLLFIMLTTTIILYKQGIARIMIVNSLMWFSFFSNLIWGTILIFSFYFMENKNAETMAYAYFFAYLFNTLIIIPFFIKKKIIPLSLIQSKWAIFIWILLIADFILLYSYDLSDIFIKLLLFISSFGAFILFFYKLLMKKE